tara:strand:+ start:227 stop:769 length:543 start_codon:yes stop_codon:yes gene_type:complete
MANLSDSNTFNVHDDYYTRKSAWKNIEQFIPKDKVIWEAFLLGSNGQSKKYLEELGYGVIGETDVDFLSNDIPNRDDYDIIVSNPPFDTEIKKPILRKLKELDKPFIIIMNAMNLFSKYFKDIFGDTDIKFIFPSFKLHYDKYNEDGVLTPAVSKSGKTDATSFYSIYVCYKIIPKNTWI